MNSNNGLTGECAPIGAFKFYCHKILPLVYDDSLSYYETLCRVTSYLNKVIENLNIIGENTIELKKAYDDLKEFVDNYFNNLDVQDEINRKLDEMAASGYLDEIVAKYIGFFEVINVKNFGAKGDGVSDDTAAFKAAIAYAENLITSIAPIEQGMVVYIPRGIYIIRDTLNITREGIVIRGESYSSVTIKVTGFTGNIFNFRTIDGSALYKNGLSNLTIYTPRSGEEHPVCVYAYKPYYATFDNLRLIDYYDGLKLQTCGKTLIDNVMMFQTNINNSSGIGMTLDGSDIHVNNAQIIPNLDKYDITLEFKDIDGAYIENSHFNGVCRITALTWDGGGGDSCNIQFSNCYFDTSSKDSFNINGWQDNCIRNIMFTGCSFMNSQQNNCLVFNSQYKTGPIIIGDSVFGNGRYGILTNKGTLLNLNNCNFHNNTVINLALNGSNSIVTGCRFTGTGYGVTTNPDACENNIIALCNFSGITSSVKVADNGKNLVVNNIGT